MLKIYYKKHLNSAWTSISWLYARKGNPIYLVVGYFHMIDPQFWVDKTFTENQNGSLKHNIEGDINTSSYL